MGFYLRKGFGLGPLRLNLSRSGAGVSLGVKGARIGIGPRGSYVHVGRGGLYYRQNLGSRGSNRVPSVPQSSEVALDDVESGNVEQMRDSSSADILDELNRVKKRTARLPIVVFLVVIVAGAFAALASIPMEWFRPKSELNMIPPVPTAEILRERLVAQRPPWVLTVPHWVWLAGSCVTLLGGVPLAVYARHLDVTRGRAVLTYDLEPEAERAFHEAVQAFRDVVACERVWHVEATGATDDWKRNAGARTLTRRTEILPRVSLPPRVASNIEVPCLPAGRQLLYFFPDRVLVYDRHEVGGVAYKDLKVDAAAVRFVEDGVAPSDAEVVEQTWRYVAKSGGPDRRFNNNRQLPVARYGELRLRSPSGLNEMFYVSRLGPSERLATSLQGLR